MGAAYLAGLATSFWKDRGEVISNLGVDREFMPSMDEELRQEHIAGWHQAVNAVRGWAEPRG